MADSLLYKQIIHFLQNERLKGRFQIAFITINQGVIEVDGEGNEISNSQFLISNKIPNSPPKADPPLEDKIQNLPPLRFSSGRTWVGRRQIEQMAESIVEFIKTKKQENIKTIAYVRGAYLEAVRLANKKLLITNYQLQITELFTDEELAQLKKKGIMWMKVGLRMPTAFIIFRMKTRFLVMENESGQLKLF